MPRLSVRSATLLGSGVVVVLTALLYDFVLPLTPGRRQLASARLIARTDLWRGLSGALAGWTPSTAGAAGTWALAGTVVAFGAYAAGVTVLWRRPATRTLLWVVGGVGALLVVAGMLALPNISTDAFNYLVTARVLTAHGADPVLTAPDAFRHDPLWAFAGHDYTSSPDNKLGVWLVFSLPFAALGGGDPVRSLLLLRVALALVALLNIALIWLILRRTAPDHACAGTALYAWNPLVAVHSTGKTDTLMVAFFLGFILLSLHARERSATGMATASVLVKAISVPFVLTLVIGQLRRAPRPGRELAVRIGVAAAVTLAVYQVLGRSPLLFAQHLLVGQGPGGGASPAVTVAVVLGLFVLTGWTVLQQDGTVERDLATSVPLAVYAVALLPAVGFAWYLMLPMALVALVRDARAAVVVVVLGVVHAARNVLDTVDTGTFHVVVPPRSLVLLVLAATLAGYAWAGRHRLTQVSRGRPN
jgi:hypothetical protein